MHQLLSEFSENWTGSMQKPKFRGLAHLHSKITNSVARLKILEAAENCGPNNDEDNDDDDADKDNIHHHYATLTCNFLVLKLYRVVRKSKPWHLHRVITLNS